MSETAKEVDGPSYLRMAEFVHRYTCQQIALADSKAGAVLAGASFALALGLQTYAKPIPAAPFALPNLIALASLVLLAASGLTAFLVILPRLSKPKRDIIYFRDVAARKDTEGYLEELADICPSPESAARALGGNAHALAGVCSRKFRLVHTSLIMLGLGILLLFLRVLV